MSPNTAPTEKSEKAFDYEKYKDDFFSIYYALWEVEDFYEQNLPNVKDGAVLKNVVYDKLKEAEVVSRCQTFSEVLPGGQQRKLFITFSSLFQDVLVLLLSEDADSNGNIAKIRRTLERIRGTLDRFIKRRGWIKQESK